MNSFDHYRQQALKKWDSQIAHSEIPVIYIGTAACGIAAGALDILEVIQQTVAELEQSVRIVQVGCIGPCYMEPIMDIAMPGGPRVSYTNVNAQKAKKILKSCLVDGDPLPQMAKGHFGDDAFTATTGIPPFFDLPMLKPQVRVILKNCGYIDPEDIDHYLAREGYQGFLNVLEKRPQYALAALKDSGLRGRGGAGFTTYESDRETSVDRCLHLSHEVFRRDLVIEIQSETGLWFEFRPHDESGRQKRICRTCPSVLHPALRS